tara:strand:- start:688 stop:1215 length:528 start_codon:yes stop_codon:yes gene_type:complete
MMIKIFFKYSLLMFVLFYSNIAMSNNEIYFVDMKFIMNNSLAGKSIIKQLNKKNESSQKKFKDKEKKLKDEEKKIISQKNVLNENEYLLKAQSFKKKVDDYKLSRNKMINDISKMKNKAQKNLTDSLSSILAEYAKKNSVAYIIPKENIIIGRAELDVTNAILEILNSKIKNIEL